MSGNAFEAGFFEGFRPKERSTVNEWADAHRILPAKASAEPGQYRTSRTPYCKAIMEALSPEDPCEIVVWMAGTQVGKTEVGNNWAGHTMDIDPGPIMIVHPTVEMAKRLSRQRIATMIEATDRLKGRVKDARQRDSGNTLLVKEFTGGILVMTGANSAIGLRSMPAQKLHLDEIDAFPYDVDGEGDPVKLAMKRTATFARNRKIYLSSTPTVKGESRIERAFNRSDKRYYHVPCLHCGFMQPIIWAQIKFERDKDGKCKRAWFECQACKGSMEEHDKDALLAGGEWVASAPKESGQIVGFHLSALYSPIGWLSWVDCVNDFLEAKESGHEELKTWTNTVLAETWEDTADEFDGESLVARREEYKAQVPADAVLLTCGVDIQDDRAELEVIAWNKGGESWSIAYEVVYGNPAQNSLWEDLDGRLKETYQHEFGHKLHIACTAIDSGGHHTQRVYEFCAKRSARRVFAVKGRGGEGHPLVWAPNTRRENKKKRKGAALFMVGVDEAKGQFYSRLQIAVPGPGYCHFPMEGAYDESHFLALTAERRRTVKVRGFPKRQWILPSGRRNEPLDCRVYGTAALLILNPAWGPITRDHKKRRAKWEEEGSKAPPKEPKLPNEQEKKPTEEPKVKPQRQRRRRQPSGWLRG